MLIIGPARPERPTLLKYSIRETFLNDEYPTIHDPTNWLALSLSLQRVYESQGRIQDVGRRSTRNLGVVRGHPQDFSLFLDSLRLIWG